MVHSLNKIDDIVAELRAAAPHLADRLDELVAATRTPKAVTRVEYVEVTRSDGTTTVMPAEDYQRLTAMDLAHTKLRILSEAEATQVARGAV